MVFSFCNDKAEATEPEKVPHQAQHDDNYNVRVKVCGNSLLGKRNLSEREGIPLEALSIFNLQLRLGYGQHNLTQRFNSIKFQPTLPLQSFSVELNSNVF